MTLTPVSLVPAVRREDRPAQRSPRRKRGGGIQCGQPGPVVRVRRGGAGGRPEIERVHRLDPAGERGDGEGVVWRRPGRVAERNLAVDHGVGEVLVVAELVDDHVERHRGVGERRTVQERETLGDGAGGGIAPLGTGKAQDARVRSEQEVEDLAGVVEDDRGQAIGRARRVIRGEVGDIDVHRQRAGVQVGRRGRRDVAPPVEGVAHERHRGSVVQRTEPAEVGIVGNVDAPGWPQVRQSGLAYRERPVGTGGGGQGCEDNRGEDRDTKGGEGGESHGRRLSARETG